MPKSQSSCAWIPRLLYNEECVLFQDQVQQGQTMPIECTSQTAPGRNAVFADGIFNRESIRQRSCLYTTYWVFVAVKVYALRLLNQGLNLSRLISLALQNQTTWMPAVSRTRRLRNHHQLSDMLFSRSWAVVDTAIPGANYSGGLLINGAWAGAASCGES